MKKLSILLCASGFLLLLATGCRSTAYHQNQAVKEAREFLLDKEGSKLTLEQREYVKFNKPTFLVSEILTSDGFGYDQVCVTWQIPGIREACMVFGYSDRQMIGWSPNRIIWRDFSPWDQKRQKAIQLARSYAIDNLFFPLSVPQFNRVRFDDPQILSTDFDLVEEYVGAPEELKQATAEQKQFSIVWALGATPEQYVVICGRGDPDLKGWSVGFGAIIPEDELKQHTLAGDPVRTLDEVNFVEIGGTKMVPATESQEPTKPAATAAETATEK